MGWDIIKKHSFLIIQICICILLLILPYYLFQGKLFLGGDDTRLFYIYPYDYLKNISFFSWVNLSSVGWNFSYQSFLPFVAVWSILSVIISSKVILGYFSFSLPFILGFIFFQKFFTELLEKNKFDHRWETLLGSLFYVLSPIVIQNHFLNPLIPIWLIGLIPAVCYFFLKFLKSNNLLYVLYSVLYITVFSFGAHNIPWEGGFFMPVVSALFIGSILYKKKDVYLFIRRLITFFSIIVISQGFWLTVFLITLFTPYSNNFTTKALSKAVVSDFANTVRVTSSGTIIYPLLNLFHRQIAFDFQWSLMNVYLSFFDKTYFLNLIYIIIVFIGILNFKRCTNNAERKVFVILIMSFVISLFLFTVNIGFLLNVYIFLGNIPGFSLFRNAYDKFALGYALIYSLLITFSLVIAKRKFGKGKIYNTFVILFIFIVVLNALSIKQIVVSPLWTTKNIYKNLTIPQEYLSFMDAIKRKISPTNNILSVPYGIAQYSLIKDIDSNNVYAGVSPVILFSGINDISGDLSFNYGPEANQVDESIINRQYSILNNILYNHNINYVIVTKNIPKEALGSYLYNHDVVKAQDNIFLAGITSKKILTSADGNYVLYSTLKRNALLTSKNLFFKKISNVKYELLIKNLKEKQPLIFNDTFYPGWNLYINSTSNSFTCRIPQSFFELKTTECSAEINMFDVSDLNYLWQQDIFANTHSINNSFSNKWVIDPEYIKKNFDLSTYKSNKDGSIDVEMTLYYKPQGYFYLGIGVSFLTICGLILFIIKKKYGNN